MLFRKRRPRPESWQMWVLQNVRLIVFAVAMLGFIALVMSYCELFDDEICRPISKMR